MDFLKQILFTFLQFQQPITGQTQSAYNVRFKQFVSTSVVLCYWILLCYMLLNSYLNIQQFLFQILFYI
jgi:hypothetical protein